MESLLELLFDVDDCFIDRLFREVPIFSIAVLSPGKELDQPSVTSGVLFTLQCTVMTLVDEVNSDKRERSAKSLPDVRNFTEKRDGENGCDDRL